MQIIVHWPASVVSRQRSVSAVLYVAEADEVSDDLSGAGLTKDFPRRLLE